MNGKIWLDQTLGQVLSKSGIEGRAAKTPVGGVWYTRGRAYLFREQEDKKHG
jgi:hypothetical protein